MTTKFGPYVLALLPYTPGEKPTLDHGAVCSMVQVCESDREFASRLQQASFDIFAHIMRPQEAVDG